MKKVLFTLCLLLTANLASAQALTFNKAEYSKDNVRLELKSIDNGALVKYESIDINGNLLQEGYYLDGKPHGKWKMYNADGSTSTMQFKYGERIALETTINGKRTLVLYKDNKPVKSIAHF